MAETSSEVTTSSVPQVSGSSFWGGYPADVRQRLLAELTDTGYIFPHTEDDLPSDDGIPMETFRHCAQMTLLIFALKHYWRNRQDVFVAGNMFVYFSPDQTLRYDFRGPDFFAVTGVENRERKSWITWNEGKGPDVVIELLSDSTAERDREEKKLIYQDQLGVANYYYYHPFTRELAGFALHNQQYVELHLDAAGSMPCPELGLSLVMWEGKFWDIETTWLRWATRDGELLPTPDEDAESKAVQAESKAMQAESKAVQAESKAAEAQQRAEETAKLLALYREKFGDLEKTN